MRSVKIATCRERRSCVAQMATFDWTDPFFLEDQLSDDERMIRDSARQFAQEKLAPRIVDAFANETCDPQIFLEMGAVGLLGPALPEQYGGVGANYVSVVLFVL